MNELRLDEDDLFAQIEEPRQISRSAWPKIQRVAHHLRNTKDVAQYYSPRMLSLGPIHHGEPHLALGDKYKLLWASMYVGEDRERVQYLHRKIAQNMKDLKDLYTEDAIRHFNDDQLARMLFVDGCALLQILKHSYIFLDPAPLNLRFDQLVLVLQDVLLLENQLPFRLLHLLSDVPDDTELLRRSVEFLLRYQYVTDALLAPPPAHHLLDQLRRIACAGFRPPPLQIKIKDAGRMVLVDRNLKELKAAGIQVKRSRSQRPIDITFSSYCFSGELELPPIIVDETFAPTYLNLMAYEVCPDFENEYEISSYVEFLDRLIDQSDDVKELRKAGILHNALGSDDKVAQLFNDISTDVVPNTAIYASLRAKIESHYQKEYKTWFALACNTYFSNPWSIIAFIAAAAALLLTFIQTWFAAFPSH